MRRQFRTMAVLACLGAASAFGAQVAAADSAPAKERQEARGGEHEHQHKGERGDHFKKMARELGLTEQQKSQAKALKESLMAGNKELFGTLKSEKRQLHALIHSGSADEAAIRAQAAKVAAAETELAVRRAQGAKQFLALLTPEQVSKYRELQAKREARGEGRFGRFGACDDSGMK